MPCRYTAWQFLSQCRLKCMCLKAAIWGSPVHLAVSGGTGIGGSQGGFEQCDRFYLICQIYPQRLADVLPSSVSRVPPLYCSPTAPTRCHSVCCALLPAPSPLCAEPSMTEAQMHTAIFGVPSPLVQMDSQAMLVDEDALADASNNEMETETEPDFPTEVDYPAPYMKPAQIPNTPSPCGSRRCSKIEHAPSHP